MASEKQVMNKQWRARMGRRITKARKRRNMSQRELSEAMGVTQSFLSHIEVGMSMPTVKHLALICKALGVSADDILCEPKPENEKRADEDHILWNARRMNAQERKLFKKVSDALAG